MNSSLNSGTSAIETEAAIQKLINKEHVQGIVEVYPPVVKL